MFILFICTSFVMLLFWTFLNYIKNFSDLLIGVLYVQAIKKLKKATAQMHYRAYTEETRMHARTHGGKWRHPSVCQINLCISCLINSDVHKQPNTSEESVFMCVTNKHGDE